MEYENNMRDALALAQDAALAGDVPVGCVVLDAEGAVIGRGRNRREEMADATAHAEIEAIREACRARGDWRLDGCTLVVTLEPCPMCAGAIINSRLSTVVYGAREPEFGSCGSVVDLFSSATVTTPGSMAAFSPKRALRCCARFSARSADVPLTLRYGRDRTAQPG